MNCTPSDEVKLAQCPRWEISIMFLRHRKIGRRAPCSGPNSLNAIQKAHRSNFSGCQSLYAESLALITQSSGGVTKSNPLQLRL